MLINVKMPTIVGILILTIMSMIHFMLNCVEHEKSFITSGPDVFRLVNLQTQIRLAIWKCNNKIIPQSLHSLPQYFYLVHYYLMIE